MHISQTELDQLEFYVYLNMGVYLTEIIEAENKAQQGDTSQQQDMMSDYSRRMNSVKNSFKPGNMKLPKV